jgi:hypothetical protein
MSETNYAPHIPDAVRRASARADELAREAGVANVRPLDEGDAGEGVTPVVNGEEETPGQPFELTPPPEPEPSRQQPTVDWEQRYNTLQGKYNSEIPELRGQINSLQTMIAQMNVQPRRAEETFEQPRTRPLPPPVREIPREDVDTYGQDLIEATQRWTEARLAPMIQDLERRVLSVEGGNQQLASFSMQNRVDAALARDIPDWDVINHDPNFILWLDQMDMFSGRKRKQMIDEAYNAGDAARTVAFFRAYKNEQTVVGQRPGIQPVQTEVTPPADRLPLADLAVPGRGRAVSSPAPGAPEQRIWTAADVNSFYRQKQQGRWTGREAEADRIERDIIAAPMEGRFRQS